MPNDEALLRRYAATRDADAFAQLVERHSGLVYATCLRVTSDAHDAEDAAQQCFLALAREAGSIRASLPGWLHATARNASLAIVNKSQKRKEGAAAMTPTNEQPGEPDWEDLEPHIDAAIQELPEELRGPVVLHYLEGRPQTEIAGVLGVDQSTVSRRLQQGVTRLREKLKKAGVVATGALLATLLTENAASAAPATLTAALGKIALAGVGQAGATAAASGAVSSAAAAATEVSIATTSAAGGTVAGKIAAVVIVGALAVGGVVAYRQLTKETPQPPKPKPAKTESGERSIVTHTIQEGNAMAGPDYSKLDYKGNGHTQDSFSLAVQAAARLLGKRPDYEMIYCLSSNAFSPAIDLGEDCTAWWHVEGSMGDRAMGTVAARIGLRAERLRFPPHNLSPEDPEEVFDRKALEHRKACAKLLRENLDTGAVVLTGGGWRVGGGGGFAPWGWWGIVTKAGEDGDLRGACLGAHPGRATGFRDRPLDYLGHTWALFADKPALTPHAADLKMLEQAVARIRGKGGFTADERATYGVDAMDAWVAKMKQTPFCVPCHKAAPDRVWTCAINNGQTTIAASKAAASYLRKRVGTFPAAARPHLEATAKHYDKIVELLRPAVTGEDGEHYRTSIGDLGKQKAHAENVLKPVKAELAAAADAMAKALAAAKGRGEKAGVRREGDRVWVEGVPDVKMTNQMRLRGMEILLRHRGEMPTLDDLLVHSGAAFHLCHGTKWELRTGLNTPSNPWDNLAAAYGYESRWTPPVWFHVIQRMPADQRKAKTDAFLDELWKSVDAGRPPLLGGAYGRCGMWRVVVGYDRENQKVCYIGGEKAYEWADLIDDKVKELGFWDMQVQGPVDPERQFTCGTWLANTAFLLGDKKRSPSERDRALAGLRLAVATFSGKPNRAYGVTYHFGEDAYEALAGDLRALDFPVDVEKKRPTEPEIYDMSHLWGQVNTIVTGRAAAARFCESAAKLMPPAALHLEDAAGVYRKEAELVKQAFAPFVGAFDETKKEREAWLAEEKNRKAGAAAVRRALEHERAAVAEIEKALAAIEAGQ